LVLFQFHPILSVSKMAFNLNGLKFNQSILDSNPDFTVVHDFSIRCGCMKQH